MQTADAKTESAAPPADASAAIRAQYDAVMTPNYAPMSIVPARGEGVKLWDADGKEYLDFAAGIAVSALGHAHPQLQRALAEQASKLWHVSNLLVNQPAIRLAQRLCDLTFAERVFFANSGSEANEAALKLARRYAHDVSGDGAGDGDGDDGDGDGGDGDNLHRHPRSPLSGGGAGDVAGDGDGVSDSDSDNRPRKETIIAFDNAFHGRTFFTVCVGGQPKYSDGFGPKPGGIMHLPFNDVAALDAAVDDATCAVILEPVQGEGGVTPATAAFVRAARAACDRHGALLIFDEVQTGAGRCGALYAHENLGVTPDILTTAKGLAGGFPISAMLTTEAIARHLAFGSHGSTFGGNPMACQVADKVLEIVSAPAMLAAVCERGAQLKAGLEAINRKRGIFAEVRGAGLLIGCEMREPWSDRARDLLNACVARGLLALVAGPNVLRLAPPLIISEAEVSRGLALLDAAAGELVSGA